MKERPRPGPGQVSVQCFKPACRQRTIGAVYGRERAFATGELLVDCGACGATNAIPVGAGRAPQIGRPPSP